MVYPRIHLQVHEITTFYYGNSRLIPGMADPSKGFPALFGWSGKNTHIGTAFSVLQCTEGTRRERGRTSLCHAPNGT